MTIMMQRLQRLLTLLFCCFRLNVTLLFNDSPESDTFDFNFLFTYAN